MEGIFCANDYVSCELPTEYGWFRFYVWKPIDGKEPVALTTQNLDTSKPVVIRIHSECLTGDTFCVRNCDCGYQKNRALDIIQRSKNGIFLYDREEGRGIGLYEKIKAINLQKQGFDTYKANEELGFGVDIRDYDIPISILNQFGINTLKVITNNPKKLKVLQDKGFDIVERIEIKKEFDEFNKKYLMEKRIIGNHLI